MGSLIRKPTTGRTPAPAPEPVAAQAEPPGGALGAPAGEERGQRRRVLRRTRGRASLLLAGDLGLANIGRKTLTGQ